MNQKLIEMEADLKVTQNILQGYYLNLQANMKEVNKFRQLILLADAFCDDLTKGVFEIELHFTQNYIEDLRAAIGGLVQQRNELMAKIDKSKSEQKQDDTDQNSKP